MTSNVSRSELCFRGIGYLILGIAGPWVFLSPPITFPGDWGVGIAITWGILILASFVAGFASFYGRYRIEMITLPLIIAALLAYAFSITYLVPAMPSRGAQALTLLAFAFMLASRFINTMKLARRPSPHTQEIDVIVEGQ